MFHGCTPLPSSGSLGKLWWVALAKWLLDVSWSHALSLSWPKSLWSGFWMVYSSLQQKAWSWARTPYGVEVYLTVFLLRLPWTTNDLISHEKYLCCCCTVSQSCLTLQPHGLQPSRLPCPSLSPIYKHLQYVHFEQGQKLIIGWEKLLGITMFHVSPKFNSIWPKSLFLKVLFLLLNFHGHYMTSIDINR